MRLRAGPILMATLAVCSASSRWRTPTAVDGVEAAKYFYNQYARQTNQGYPVTTLAPGECYTKNQGIGKCVKTSMCHMEPPKIDATTLFEYRTLDKSKITCEFLKVCCPIDKIGNIPDPPTINSPPGCGYSNAAAGRFRTLMGTSDSGYADFAEFPWMVALLKNSRYNPCWDNTDYLGGGTLIHPSVVLTVAHKVDTMAPRDLKCRAGEWDTEYENEQFIHQDREVKKIILHEQFERLHAQYDAALLIMKTPFLLEPHINVACLSQTMPPPGTLCYSMGWGVDFTKGTYNANVLKKDPRDLRYSVVGMVVYGLDLECGTQDPGTYADVPELYNWINRLMKREGFFDRFYTI